MHVNKLMDGRMDRHTPVLPPCFLLSLQAFSFFLLAGLVVEIVWAVLWFLLKWYLVLKNRYEGEPESSHGEGEEKDL